MAVNFDSNLVIFPNIYYTVTGSCNKYIILNKYKTQKCHSFLFKILQILKYIICFVEFVYRWFLLNMFILLFLLTLCSLQYFYRPSFNIANIFYLIFEFLVSIVVQNHNSICSNVVVHMCKKYNSWTAQILFLLFCNNFQI